MAELGAGGPGAFAGRFLDTLDETTRGAEEIIIVTKQREIAFNALVHRGIGEPLRATVARP